MIRLEEMLKVIVLDGQALEVYVKTGPYESRRIFNNDIPKYYNRAVDTVSVDMIAVDYDDDCYPKLYMYVTVEGPMLEENI